MRRVAAALAVFILLAAARLARASHGDWFSPFSGLDAFLVEDSSWLAKDPANMEGPALLKVRHVLIIYRADGEARLWPRRNILLIEVPGGGKWATELGEGTFERRGSEPRPHTRISNGRAVLEGWISGEETDKRDGGDDPCGGSRMLVRAAGREVEFFGGDAGTKSVRALLKELREAALSDGERKELELFRRLRIPEADAPPRLLAPEAAWDLVALTAPGDGSIKSVVLVPDAERDPDLAPWNAITWIPSPLSPMDLPEGL